VQILQNKLAGVNGKADSSIWELSLASNILYIMFEVLVGDDVGYSSHIATGFNLAKNMLAEYKSKEQLPGNLDELADAYSQLDIQTSICSLEFQTLCLRPSLRIPETFYSLVHAKSALIRLLPTIQRATRAEPVAYGELTSTARTPHNMLLPSTSTLTDLKSQLQQWLDTLNKLTASLNEDLKNPPVHLESIKFRIGHDLLMMRYWAAIIWLETPGTISQTAFDLHLSIFTRIVMLVLFLYKTSKFIDAYRHSWEPESRSGNLFPS
jgi:hypothetical protein